MLLDKHQKMVNEVLMSSKRYPEEFKIEAVKKVTEKGHSLLKLLNN
jgi:transposase-like protein